jgi:hypothetical protein
MGNEGEFLQSFFGWLNILSFPIIISNIGKNMKQFINTEPKCDECGGSLEIQSIQIDFVNCTFILFTNCIVCGEEMILNLSLTDFIELSKLSLGGENGKD